MSRYRPCASNSGSRRRTQCAVLTVVPVNEAQVCSTTQAVTDTQAEAALTQARPRADVLAVLTLEQLEAIEEAQAVREARQERVREGRISRTSRRALVLSG